MGKLDVIERAANRLLQHNVAEARIAIELMQEKCRKCCLYMKQVVLHMC